MGLLNLLIKISADGAQAQSTVGSLQKSVQGLGSTLKSAFSFGALATWTGYALQAADASQDMAEQMNITVSQLFRLERAAVSSGLGMDAFQKLFVKVAEARKKAGEGDEEAAKMLDRFGVSLQDVNNAGLETIDIIDKLRQRMQEMGKLSPADEAMWATLTDSKNVKSAAALRNLGQNKMSPEDAEWTDKLVGEAAGVWSMVESGKTELKQSGQKLVGRVSLGLKTIKGLFKGIAEGDVTKYLMQDANAEINAGIAEAERKEELKRAGNLFTEKVDVPTGSTTHARSPLLDGIRRSRGGMNPATSASSYGNFIFGAYNNEASIANQQLYHLRRLDEKTPNNTAVIQKSIAGVEAAIGLI